jgi:excisionase family DNA binding protein
MTATYLTPDPYSFLTFAQFCELMSISESTGRRWFASGHHTGACPRFVKPGKEIRIRRDWFDAWVEGLLDAAA